MSTVPAGGGSPVLGVGTSGTHLPGKMYRVDLEDLETFWGLRGAKKKKVKEVTVSDLRDGENVWKGG